jgi:hypothetical protein
VSPAVPDLSVQVGALRLRNPIVAASGTFGYGLEFSHLVHLERLGGFVTKGLSREPIEGAPAPRLCETAAGMLNAVGLQNVGVRAFVSEKLPLLKNFDVPVIANVFGYEVDDYACWLRTEHFVPQCKKGGYAVWLQRGGGRRGSYGRAASGGQAAVVGKTDATCYRHWTYR